jgi:hypothetical protein
MVFRDRTRAGVQNETALGDIDLGLGIGGQGELQRILDVLGKNPLILATRTELMEQRGPGHRHWLFQNMQPVTQENIKIERGAAAG